jgi:hypothetical protein
METIAYVQTERERHYKIVAFIQIVYASLGLIFGSIAALLLFGLSILPGFQGPGMSEFAILRILSFVAIGVTVLTTLPALIGGIGLLKKQPWARILLLVVAVFDLFSFPIGTVIGVYTLWALWEPIDWRRRGISEESNQALVRHDLSD